MKPAHEDIEQRVPVWEMLSRLFLDTEHDADDLRHLAERLLDHPYEVEELETILFDEVYPVCSGNMCVAGEWAGFDLDWLSASILKHQNARFKFPRWLQWNRWMIQGDWQQVKENMKEIRREKENSPVQAS